MKLTKVQVTTMAKNKFYYYVGVVTHQGLSLVTKKDNGTKSCYWNEKEKPIAMPESVATDTAWGLNLNGFGAFVIKSHTELEGHFVATERTPSERCDYSGADINLLNAYEEVMNFNNPFVTYYGNIDAYYFTETMVNSFDVGAVEDRFLEVLDIIGVSYNEWSISRLSKKSAREIRDYLVKKLTVETLPVNEEDYCFEDIRLIAAYERANCKSFQAKDLTVVSNGIGTKFEWKYSSFKPVLVQKRFAEALNALGVTYEEWKVCKERHLFVGELDKIITANLKEIEGLPYNADDYDADDIKLIACYEAVMKIPYNEKITNWFGDYAIHEWKMFPFQPEVAQKRFREALKTIHLTYSFWKENDYRHHTSDKLEADMLLKMKLSKITDEVIDQITEQNKEVIDFIYALMNIAELPDEYVLGYLTDAFGHKYSAEELGNVLAKYKEENK